MMLLQKTRRPLVSLFFGVVLGIALHLTVSTAKAQTCAAAPGCSYWCVDYAFCSECFHYSPCWIEYGRCYDDVDQICTTSTQWKACGFCES